MAKRVTTIPATLNRFTSVPMRAEAKRKVAGYARVSTDNEEQQTSYEAQMEYYRDYITGRKDWQFVGMYSDEGISATNTKHRDGFNRMINDALAGKIELIITKSISRFARNTVDSLTTVRKLKEKGVEVYCMPIPTSAGVMISSEYQEKIKCADQGASIAYLLGAMDDNVRKVNIFNNLVAHNDEYIYFRTDHHWTALGAYYAYETLCAAAHMEAKPLEEFELLDEGEFKGTFYFECMQNWRLRIDELYAYLPPGNLEMKITTADGATFPFPIIQDMSHSLPGTKYMTFIAGDQPMTCITNFDLPDAPVCVVIKDSFGNPFVPYLSQNYSKVYVVDYRSYNSMSLKAFVDAYDVDQVIFAQALPLAESEGTIGLTRWLCR